MVGTGPLESSTAERAVSTKIELDLRGRLRNFNLPATRSLFPVFEAVINALHAIEAGGRKTGVVTIEVIRGAAQTMLPLGHEATGPALSGFRIVDDGIGFTDDNYNSFCTSDSMFKHRLGGRGVGRFTWLKAFESVQVDSVYRDARDVLRRRVFSFSEMGISSLADEEYNGSRQTGTVLTLGEMKSQYLATVPKKLSTIGQRLVDHCFESIRATSAKLSVRVEAVDGGERFGVSAQIAEMLASALEDTVDVGGERFHLTHLRVTSPDIQSHRLAFLADRREVRNDSLLSTIPQLVGRLEGEDGAQFWWLSLVESPALDRAVNSERDAFQLPEDSSVLFPGQLSMQSIRKELKPVLLRRMEPFIKPIKERTAEQVSRFVQDRAPEYRHLVALRPELIETLPPDLPEEKLEAELHRISYRFESDIRERGREILRSDETDRSKYDEFLSEANAVGKANLAKYIVHRRVIIELFEKALARRPDGGYALEEAVHGIIFPLRTTSDEVPYEQLNLWMIDERLAYHQYLASDKSLRSVDVLESEERTRPDLIIFNKPFAFSDQPGALGSVVIVEFKRPARDDYTDEENPISQVYEYVRKVRAGVAKDRLGRPISAGKNLPFYCYIICDITPHLRDVVQMYDLKETPDEMGFFGYNVSFRAYVEVISFDKLLVDARKRNRVLFEKLRLP